MINPYKANLKAIENEEKITLKNLEKQKTNSKKLLFVKVANDKLKCKACWFESQRKIVCRHCWKIWLRRENPWKCNWCWTYITCKK